jgi:hypothetical protein
MPLAAQLWGALLPLTHFLALLLGQAMRGAPASAALAPLGALLRSSSSCRRSPCGACEG